MGLIERLTAEATSLKGALRTLKMTTPIAKHPTRVFPQVITELAAKYGDAPALLSDRERFSYRELAAPFSDDVKEWIGDRWGRAMRTMEATCEEKGDTAATPTPSRCS